jgi:MFS family permease
MLLGINTMANKVISSLLVVLMGFTNACASGGFFGYTGCFPLEMIVSFTAGQGISGIGLNILQFIVIASVKIEDEKKRFIVRGWIFFGFSILILIVCLILLLYSYKDEYCKYYLNKGRSPGGVSEKSEAKLLKSMTGDDDTSNNTNESGKNQQIETLDNDYKRERENDINMVKVVPSFAYVFKKIWDIEVMACFCYVVTFILFPNACTTQKVFNIGEYKSVTIIAIYNALDTVGRYIVNCLPQNKKLDFGILIGRIVLIFTIIFNYYCQVKLGTSLTTTSILIIIYSALLGVTNGIGAALTFGLASKNAEDEIKEQVGNSIGFCCILGIFIGSVLAFGSGAIIEAIEK